MSDVFAKKSFEAAFATDVEQAKRRSISSDARTLRLHAPSQATAARVTPLEVRSRGRVERAIDRVQCVDGRLVHPRAVRLRSPRNASM